MLSESHIIHEYRKKHRKIIIVFIEQFIAGLPIQVVFPATTDTNIWAVASVSIILESAELRAVKDAEDIMECYRALNRKTANLDLYAAPIK